MTTTRPDDDEEVPVRPFADFLREQSQGETHAELSDALQTIVQAVLDTGKVGVLQLQIRVEPMKGGRRGVTVSDAIKIKLPEHDRDASMFFADKNNNLHRNDPDQLSFESLREVPPPPGVDVTTGEITDPKAGEHA